MAVGRISGPLLKANLVRQGIDLAFETNLLYLDVNNGRVGIKTASPTHDLTVNGTTRTTNIEATTQADLASFTITSNTIASSNSTINISPSGSNPVVYQAKVVVDSTNITGNTISTTGTNTDLNITTTGQLVVNSNMLVNGNLHATGSITADGNITLGDANTDNIVFTGEVNSNITPNVNNSYTLGTSGLKWSDLFTQNLTATTVTTSGLTVAGVDLNLRQGNIIYVSKNGNDSSSGTHENDPYLTITKALSVATSGTTVYVYPGTYTEVFPLTIPVGVTLKGTGIRAVTIQPTGGTIDKDAILLNGETTVEDLTITGFRYNGTNNTGYGFRFASNFTVTTRSPYIRNVTILTRGSVVSSADPYGFDQNDAGKGALADGSVANSASKEASMLFHSVTFFTPNQECISATNGVRIEWLNSFSYFADKGFYLTSGSTGFAGAGLTRLHINSRVGTWAIGNTVTYYDTDRTTVLASGTIASIDATNNYVNLTGKCVGFQTITDRSPKTVYAQGGAKLSTAQKKWGTASLALDGTGDYVTVATQPDFDFGTDAFCLEAWIYNTAQSSANQIIFDFRSSNPSYQPAFYINGTTNTLRLAVNGASVLESAATIPLNTWTHIALAKSGTSTKIFINGTQSGSTYTDNNTYIQGPLTLGARFDGTSAFFGYIDDVKISKGVARYTSNFTAPTGPLTGDLDTVLLLHFNGNNNSTTFIDDGVTYQDIRTNAGGTASLINFADYSDFGVEVRSIGSAAVYGNYGAVGDGDGVVAYLVSTNFAYVGAGKKITNDPTDRIAANEVVKTNRAKIYFTSVDNEGNFKVGDKFYVNQKTGEVLFNNQALTITAPDGVTFTDGLHTTSITATDITTGNIRVHDNNVDSLTGAITVSAANGVINLQNNTFITGDLDVTGNVTIGGNITFGDQTTDTISFVAGINSSLVPATTGVYDLGTSSLRWNNLYLSGSFNTAGNVTATGNLTSNGYLQLSDVRISSNTVQTTTTNTDLNLQANGSGNVVVEGIKVDANNIQSVASNSNITLTPNGSGSVIVNSNQSIQIPVGDTSQRPATPSNGMIRYNSELGQYEGWNGTYWLKLSGVQDLDGNTKVTAELTPGANDNTIRFYADGTVMATIDSTKMYAVDFQTSQLDVTSNTISTLNTNTDINLLTTGTGGVVVGNLKFNNNTITNVSPDSVTVFNQQGGGYTKIAGTNGVVIPSGTTLNRPSIVETGMMRFNTESQITEVYNGVIWTSVAGTLTGVTFDDAQNIGVEVALLFG